MIQQNPYIKQPVFNLGNAIEAMRKFFRENTDLHNIDYTFYHEYTPQQVLTDENYQIRELGNYITPGSKVLTLGGTGDHALFCKLYGAEYVLTFDYSCHSYLISSLKTAAIKAFLNTDDYSNFLRDLQAYAPDLYKIRNITRVLSQLPANQREYIITANAMHFPLCVSNNTTHNLYELSQENYNKLRNSVSGPFPFIQTNITELNKKLCGEKFEMVYFSNALDFVKPNEALSVLENTKNNMTQNGVLFITTQHGKFVMQMTELCKAAFKQPDWNIKPFFALQGTRVFNHFIIQRNQNTK